ncbi:MAG: rhodanese-like domain-containing protein [Muribaculaceae bacterium]|nr:rhodanese-like domain-containing protein [Muribaculaceae bacterium]
MNKINPKSIALLGVILITLLAMSCSSTTKASQPMGNLETVSPEIFEKGLKKGNVQLLDVRSAEEYEQGHIQGSINIDVQEPDFQAEVSNQLEKDKPIYVYCRSGRRSLLAGEMLAKDGYTVMDLDGGILGWEKAGLPVVND